MIEAPTTPTGSLRTFFVVWAGQLVSVLGTTMSAFAVQIWIYTETGSVTNLALVSLAFALPATLVSPFAGALVDRWDRRIVMIASDGITGLATLAIAALYVTDHLALWHVFVLVTIGSVGNAFQAPAWMASIPLLVPKAHLGRANGLVQFNDGVSLVMAPALAGVVLVVWGLGGMLLIDVATFLVAVGTLLIVRFPRPDRTRPTTPGRCAATPSPDGNYVRERPACSACSGCTPGSTSRWRSSTCSSSPWWSPSPPRRRPVECCRPPDSAPSSARWR